MRKGYEKITQHRVSELLGQLVGIPSPYFKEEAIMNFAKEWLGNHGVPAQFHKFHESKIYDYAGINVVGSLQGTDKGPHILLNGHLDTVKLCEGWTRDPYAASVEGDRMYGLGTCDMKSGCVAIMLALEAFLEDHQDFRGRIDYSLVCDEEGPFGLGTDALIVDGIMSPKADVAVITEPSSAFADVLFPSICLGARGGWNYKITVEGKSAHGAQPELGINAITEAAKILLELEKTQLPSHEKLGSGSLCCIDFQGGGAALSVPDEAQFSIFRHVVVGVSKETLRHEAEEAIKRANIRGKATISFRDAPHPDCDGFPAYVVPEDNPYVQVMEKALEDVTGKKPVQSYFASVGDFCYTGGRLGIPTLVVGAKGGNYHGADEYVELPTVLQSTQALYRFLASLCGEES